MQASLARQAMRLAAYALGATAGLFLLLSPYGRGSPGLLGHDMSSYPEDLTALVKRAQSAPADADIALNAASALIAEGRASGDATLVSAASTLLSAHLAEGASPDLLTQAAVAAQYLHEFDRALDLLDRTLARDPGNIEALLTRTNILVVQGRLETASQDCRRLAVAGRPDIALLCDATVNALGPAAPQAGDRLLAILKDARFDRALAAYAWSLSGEIALFQDETQLALSHMEQAMALDPDSLRTRMLLADILLRLDRPAEALSSLAGTPDTDPLLVRKAIAYRRLGQSENLDEAIAILERRFNQNIRQGEGAHAREEARFYLEVTQNPQLAADRAMVNWSHQREYEDAWLLIESSQAAARPQGLDAVRQWMAAQNVTAPALSRRLAAPL